MTGELEAYCREHGIDAELIETSGSAKSAADAARELGTDKQHIIKSIVCMAAGEPVIVVVRGPDRIDLARLAETLEVSECRLATPDEVKQVTDYPVGAVPPVGTDVPKVVDEHVLQYDEVFGGGGSQTRIIAMDPRFIVSERDRVADITE